MKHARRLWSVLRLIKNDVVVFFCSRDGNSFCTMKWDSVGTLPQKACLVHQFSAFLHSCFNWETKSFFFQDKKKASWVLSCCCSTKSISQTKTFISPVWTQWPPLVTRLCGTLHSRFWFLGGVALNWLRCEGCTRGPAFGPKVRTWVFLDRNS